MTIHSYKVANMNALVRNFLDSLPRHMHQHAKSQISDTTPPSC